MQDALLKGLATTGGVGLVAHLYGRHEDKRRGGIDFLPNALTFPTLAVAGMGAVGVGLYLFGGDKKFAEGLLLPAACFMGLSASIQLARKVGV